MILLPTAYFGNIQYYSKLACGEEVRIEACENYVKQTYRNRCDILAVNGVVPLTVPVRKGGSANKTPIREMEIDYGTEWQKQHWKSLCSAYGSSPYFDYFDYLFRPLYTEKEKYLWEYNKRCMETVFRCAGLEAEIRFTDDYEPLSAVNPFDYRDTITPKTARWRPDPFFRAVPYYQVFADRYGFCPNLSILDLLFCEGPETVALLKRCYVYDEK